MSSTPDDLPPVDEEEPSDERLPLTELESISARPPSWRKRGAQLALLALALCVGLVATWSVIIPKRQPAQPASPPIPISALLVSNLTNATITLNGKKLSGHPPMTVSAYLEQDVVTIAAPLFRPRTCHFKGLVSEEDTTNCLFTSNNGLVQNGAAFIIGVYLTPDDLLPAQQNQVIAPIMQQLSASLQTTTQPGDAIPTAFAGADYTITSRPATTPLQARAMLAQSGPQSSISHSYPYFFSPSCEQLFCPSGFGPAPPDQAPSGQVWGLLLNVTLRWRFTNGTGTTIADVTYPSDSPAGLFLSLPQVQFVYDGTGWRLAAGTDLNAEMPAFLCDNGMTILGHRVSPPNNMGPVTNKGVEGCLIPVQAKGANGTFLWRFGVLLAADAGAHTILPDLPIAPPAAIATVSG
jgi:hypothetical protein